MSLPIFQRTIVDSSGNIQPGASVAVRNETTGDLVTIYADREGSTAKANPFLADAEGFATFYVETGEYQVTATTPAGAITWSHVAIGDTALLELEQPTGSALVGFQQSGGVVRTVESELKERVSLRQFGAVLDGVADDTESVTAAFVYAGSVGAKVVHPGGACLITGTVTWPVSSGFGFEGAPGAVFKAGAGFAVDAPMFRPTASSGANRFEWRGGKIDGRLMPARASGAPDLLYIATPNIVGVDIEGVHFVCNDTRSGTAGDSCLFLAEGEDYRVVNNVFQGAADAGCYISGNALQTTGRRCVAYGNTFLECNVGFISKRYFEDHVVHGNFPVNCNFGIVVGGEAGTELLPGHKASIIGNVSRRCGCAIQVRKADGTVVVGNRIEDYAINAAGVAQVTAAIRIEGSKDCLVTGNHTSSPGVAQIEFAAAVLVTPITLHGVTYQSENNLIDGNVFKDANIGVREMTGSNFNTIGAGNKYVNCGTPVAKIGGRTVVGAELVGTTPALYWNDTAGGADSKMWRALASGNQMTIGPRSDVDGSGDVLMQVTRSGTTLTGLLMARNMFPNYADDAAAALGGLPVQGMYRTGSTIKMRVA